MNCKNCGVEIDGSFGFSGKFCSRKCSNTRKHSDKTKEKIRLGVLSQAKIINKICSRCHSVFSVNNIRSSQKYCSNSCRVFSYLRKQEIRKLAHKQELAKYRKNNRKKSGGLRDGGGHSKVLNYYSTRCGIIRLNKDEIRVAKLLDKTSLNWIRNTKGFEYTNREGKIRKYYPDFYISDYDVYLEYKGWVIDEMMHKMTDAVNKNKFNLKIIFSKRFENLGKSIDYFEKNYNEFLMFIREVG